MARLLRMGPDGRTADTTWEVGEGITLGRSGDCDVVLEDDQVSRHHARVFPEGPAHVVEDLGSANGVFVGEERIRRSAIAPGQAFRVGGSWFMLEPAPPGSSRRSPALTCAVLGCFGMLAIGLVAGAAFFFWQERGRVGPPAAVSSPGEVPSPWSVASSVPSPASAGPRTVPLSESDVLRFTVRVASNAVLTQCARMPASWAPPLLEARVAARVGPDGGFRYTQDWSDATGAHHIDGAGTWKDGALQSRGRWTTRASGGGAAQEDEGSFTATGRIVLGAWFGDRIEGEFLSRSDSSVCREQVANGVSRVEALDW